VQHDLSILALIKGRDRYFYVFDDSSLDRLIETIREHAASPAVSLSWFDAKILTERARQQVQEAASESKQSRRQG
jgi:hypothetical protein